MKNLSKPGKALFVMSISFYMYASVLLFWPYAPIEIHSIRIVSPMVEAGGILAYEIDYTKKTAYPVTHVSRQLIDGSIILLPSSPHSNFPVGNHRKIVYAKIPQFAPTGTYHMHISATYQVNPLRTVTVTADSNEFEVKGIFNKL